MCGIAGFTGFNNNVVLASMANEIQKHRGPDNQSIWSDEKYAFAHQRLSIIDLNERSNQPLHKDNLMIIFNGEIYNYIELKQKLNSEKQVSFNTSSDTEVVLELYHHYGIGFLDMLIGMFAFAIYNKTTEELLLVRDHFGIKPIFYTQIENSFAFSSELKTLTKIPGFDKTINPKSLVSSLNYLWIAGNESIFNNCYKLPPAHYMLYSAEKEMKIIKYWEIKENKVQINKINEDKFIDQVAQTIESSVKRHMVADVPVSSFLSGGLDSSLIAVIAKKTNDNLSTYTIGTSEKDKEIEKMPDDEKYANIIAKQFHFDHSVIEIRSDHIKMLPEMVKILDEPVGDPSAINVYLMCMAARKKGVKVLLSGMGADEIFFGYRRQKATLMTLRFNKLPNAIKKLSVKISKSIPVIIGRKGFRLGRWAKRFLSLVSLPIDQAYMRSYSYYNPEDLKNLVTEPYKKSVDVLIKEHKELFESKYKNDIINQICHTDLSMFMLGLNLTVTDRSSMAASVEVRVPFIDKLVIEQAMTIPGNYKIKNGVSKFILKKAAERFLPEKIIYRPKASFGAPIRSWISNDLKPMVDDILSDENIRRRGILNPISVKNIIENDRKGIEDNAYQIYQFLTLELWCREYLD